MQNLRRGPHAGLHQLYCRTKAEAYDQANWIGIGEGASGGLFVILIERKPELPLTSVFLQPQAARPETLLTASDQESDGLETDQLES